jgi:plastocyanin
MTTRLIRSRAASLLVASLLAGLTACDDTPTAAPTITADPVTPDLVFTPAALRVAPGDTARAGRRR